MSKRNMIKGILGFGASVGAGMIVTNVARATTPLGAGKIYKGFIRLGTFAIGGIVGDKAEAWIGKQVDNIADGIEGVVKAAKEAANEPKPDNVIKIDEKKED